MEHIYYPLPTSHRRS